MKHLFATLSGVVLSLSLMLTVVGQAHAAATSQEPQAIVESVAQELFALVKEKNDAKTADAAYLKKVEKVLDGVVNFRLIAASVMGKANYAKATAAQREEFLTVFKSGMVKSLGNGILGYADSKVTLAGVVTDAKNPKRVVVKQELSADGANHKLDYTMLQGKSGDWKLINVILNGVNLGHSFSGQFKAGMKKHDGNIDLVIANWLTDV